MTRRCCFNRAKILDFFVFSDFQGGAGIYAYLLQEDPLLLVLSVCGKEADFR